MQSLWFDVEKRYKTIGRHETCTFRGLWFDVEKRYKTMKKIEPTVQESCGLM